MCCFCDYEKANEVQMEDCGHRLCTYCFTGYLQAKLGSGPEVVYAICPDQKCNNIVPEKIFRLLLNPIEFAKYEEYVLNSFVDLSKTVKWCPGKNCGKICETTYAEAIDIFCDCGEQYCFEC